MGSFKNFLKEDSSADVLNAINHELSEMNDEEIDMLGAVLTDEFFDESDEYDEFMYSLEDVQHMIAELGAEFYDYILELIDDDAYSEKSELDEAVSRKMKQGSFNRKKRLFMTKSKAELRKTAQQRKRKNREDRSSNRAYRRANKKKIQSYQKSRALAIKKGKHNVKLRRKS